MNLDIYIAMEESYKNGYIKGCEDTKKELDARKGRWIVKNDTCFCSVCMTCGSPQWKRCPVCEAKMEVVVEDWPEAKTIHIENIGKKEVNGYGET